MQPWQKHIKKTLQIMSSVYDTQKSLEVEPMDPTTCIITKNHLKTRKLNAYDFNEACRKINEYGWAHIGVINHDDMAEMERIQNELKNNPELIPQWLENTFDNLINKSENIVGGMLGETFNIDAQSEITPEDKMAVQKRAVVDIFDRYNKDTVAVFSSSPFMSIHRVLDRINSGEDFEMIKPNSALYDINNYVFYINSIPFRTKNKKTGKVLAIDTVLSYLYQGQIDPREYQKFEDMIDEPSEDPDKAKKQTQQLYDACDKFIKEKVTPKYPQFNDVFEFGRNQVRINKKYFEIADLVL